MNISSAEDNKKFKLFYGNWQSLVSLLLAREPLKACAALGIDPYTTFADLHKDDVFDTVKYAGNADDVIAIIHNSIEKVYGDVNIKEFTDKMFSHAKHPLAAYKLLDVVGVPFFYMDYVFAHANNLPELFQVYGLMGYPLEQFVERTDDFDIKKILRRIRSLENYNFLEQAMGEKLLDIYELYTTRDWNSILTYIDNEAIKAKLNQYRSYDDQ
jgi:hypothetical protein